MMCLKLDMTEEQMEQAAQTAQKRIEERVKEAVQEKFRAANEKSLGLIADYIADGYLDTLAHLLVYIGQERAKAALEKLPEAVRSQAKPRYDALVSSGKKNVDADIIAEAGPVLKKSGFYGKAMSGAVLEGLSGEERGSLAQLTDSFFEQNPILAMNVERNLFVFEDLLELDDRSVQKVLREVDQQDLCRALKNADAEVQNKIFRNMSERAAEMLKEDMEFMGQVRANDIYAAQQIVIDIVKRLEENGDITLAREAFV